MAARAPAATRQARPPAMGLLASAEIVVNGSDTEDFEGRTRRWIDGFTLDPEDCVGGELLDPCGDVLSDPSSDSPDDVAFEPYVIEAAVQCSTLGNAATERDIGRAQRKLRAVRQKRIEEELWSGTLAQAAGWPNNYLTNSPTEIGGGAPFGYVTALARLEEAIGDALDWGEGMIHATRETFTLWMSAHLIMVDGNVARTGLGTIVVPGRGYAGTDSSGVNPGDGDWAYATGIVSVRLGAERLPEPGENTETTDRETNTRIVRASQFAAATWDGCLLVGVNVDHDTDLTTTGS